MLVDIQTFVLDASRNAQAVNFLNGKEEHDTTSSGP
jgi:hypothetical protein